jgi:hypothetical protein
VQAGAEERAEDAVTPYRPSVSNPAQLPVPGQLELEIGGLRTRSSAERTTGLPYLLKLAFTPEWGVLVGGDAQTRTRDAGGATASGFGDTTLALKRAWIVDEANAFGAELGIKFPTAKTGLGSGERDTTLTTIYSRDLGATHLDANLGITRLGLVEPGLARTQWGASLSLSHSLNEHWGIGGEISGTKRAGAENGRQLQAALTWSPNPRLTFDVGVARATRPSPAATTVFAGVVFPIARLW